MTSWCVFHCPHQAWAVQYIPRASLSDIDFDTCVLKNKMEKLRQVYTMFIKYNNEYLLSCHSLVCLVVTLSEQLTDECKLLQCYAVLRWSQTYMYFFCKI